MECLPTKDQAEKAISTVYDLTRVFPDEVSFCQKNMLIKTSIHMQILVRSKVYYLYTRLSFCENRLVVSIKHTMYI